MAQSILVTGASSGFGRLTVETLARKGHTVFAAMRGAAARNADAARELDELSKKNGWQVHTVDLDVGDDQSVRAGVTRAIEIAGHLDVVVNNAGVMAAGITEAFLDDQLRTIFDTNVLGVHRVFRAALPHMRARGAGLFVTVSSSMAQITYPFAAAYTASKRAVDGLAETYRYELAPLGIDSVLIEPGGFATPLLSKIEGPADAERAASYGPLAEMPGKFFGSFAASLKAPDAPDPQRIADAIAALIEAPAGTRPLRTAVDYFTGDGQRAIAETSTKVQEQVFTAFGLRELLSVKPR